MPIILFISALSLSAESQPQQKSLDWFVQNTSKLEKVTPLPLKMNPVVVAACSYLPTSGDPIPSGPHSEKYFDVFITSSGSSIMANGKGTYPEGTVVLKKKYSDENGSVVELYTGMIKRAKGFNLKGGDWEYFTASADGRVTLRGALASCMACHEDYQKSDYVTRAYFSNKADYAPPSSAVLLKFSQHTVPSNAISSAQNSTSPPTAPIAPSPNR